MKEYTVKTLKKLDWDEVPKAEISTFLWGGDYEPVCYAQCAFVENEGMFVKMTAYEANPRAEKLNFGDAVCTDSCLEFFFSFDPQNEVYVNFETNCIGTSLITRRVATGNRVPINKFFQIPKINAICGEDKWSVEYMFTFEQILALFPEARFEKGAVFRANFYKCGDETEIPHFGMWNIIDNGKPSFHQPEFFGKMIIK